MGWKIPANLKLPLRDGDIDRPDDEAYANSYFFNANSRQAPQVVDSHVQPILDQNEVYSGCYGKISCRPSTDITPTETVGSRLDSAIFRNSVTGKASADAPQQQKI